MTSFLIQLSFIFLPGAVALIQEAFRVSKAEEFYREMRMSGVQHIISGYIKVGNNNIDSAVFVYKDMLTQLWMH